jgi:hypothetical protein
MIWIRMFAPLEIPGFYGGDQIIKLQSLKEKVGGQSPIRSNGVYANHLDQAGLDSPPFDGVSGL